MIEIKQLRLGNLILHEGKVLPILAIDGERTFTNTKIDITFKGTVTIPQIDNNGLIWTTNGRWIYYCEPISLTKEILYEIGYRQHRNNFMILGHTIFCADNDKLFLCDKNGITIKHLHQLQNIFFFINDTEIEIDYNSTFFKTLFKK